MEYVLFIHSNVDSPTTEEQWDRFYTAANQSGLFTGGSEIGNRVQIGSKSVTPITNTVGGYMCFESNNVDEIHELLKLHPIVIQGGTVELCETPKN